MSKLKELMDEITIEAINAEIEMLTKVKADITRNKPERKVKDTEADKAQGCPIGKGMTAQVAPIKFLVGQPVSKKGGDYRFDGFVVSAFTKISGEVRYVVEDDRGILHIYSDKNLIGA